MVPDLFSIMPDSERAVVERAFSNLSTGKLEDSLSELRAISNGNYSAYARSFADYGLAVSYMQLPQTPDTPINVDIPISYLRRSLQVLQHADSYLLLAQALEKKVSDMILQPEIQLPKYEEMQKLLDESRECFENARKLNPAYASICKTRIIEIRKTSRLMLRRKAELN